MMHFPKKTLSFENLTVCGNSFEGMRKQRVGAAEAV